MQIRRYGQRKLGPSPSTIRPPSLTLEEPDVESDVVCVLRLLAEELRLAVPLQAAAVLALTGGAVVRRATIRSGARRCRWRQVQARVREEAGGRQRGQADVH